MLTYYGTGHAGKSKASMAAGRLNSRAKKFKYEVMRSDGKFLKKGYYLAKTRK